MATMALEDFVLAPRGPARFDCYEHPNRVASPLGEFTIELAVKVDSRPTPEMVQAANILVSRFEQDRELISQMVFEEYKTVCGDRFGAEWLEECGVPMNLSLSDIQAYLNPRTLSVHDDCSAALYLGPDWDREHGLTYELNQIGWEKVH